MQSAMWPFRPLNQGMIQTIFLVVWFVCACNSGQFQGSFSTKLLQSFQKYLQKIRVDPAVTFSCSMMLHSLLDSNDLQSHTIGAR